MISTTLAMLLGCPGPENQQNKTMISHEMEAISLEVRNPGRFVDRKFPDEFGSYRGTLLVRTINGRRWLDIVDEGERIRIEIELVSITGHANNCTIQANSIPMSLNDAVSHALSIAGVSKIDGTKLDLWRKNLGDANPIGNDVLVTGEQNGIANSVQVRSSFESDRPWRVIFQSTFRNSLVPGED